jgi:nicotinamidase-related amidase
MIKTTLLLIDLQNDYFPGGKNPLVGSLQAVEKSSQLLAAFRRLAWPVLHIQHFSTRPGASFFVPGTPGVEIHPAVQPLPTETVIQKNYPNGFRQTALGEKLVSLEVQRLVVSGMMTHMCLDAGVRAAVDLGYECWVASDACASKDLVFEGQTIPAAQVQAAFLAALASAYARVLPVEQVLAELDKLTTG